MKDSSILIVEDEQISAMDLQGMIEEDGYTVEDIVETGQKALNVLEEQSIDLVLMDVELPGDLDGVQTANKIHQEDVSVIFLTAYSDDNTLARAKSTNPAGFLIKPVTQADLRASIEMALPSRTD